MPKKVYEINPFHGGINTKDDARDILDHQLVDAKGVTVDSKGVLKVIGNAVDLDTTAAYVNTTNEAGYGFARFSSDTNAAGSSGTDATNRDYLIYWDEGDEKLYWYNSTDDAWTEIVDLSTAWSGSARKVIFSYSKGALRACDSNFDNTSNENYIAFLFASVSGVSKLGSFTKSGATNVDCGFTGDTPSFILIKRTDSTGNWYIFDSARGIVAGNDKSLYLNANADQVTNADVVDPYSGGFATTSSLTNGDYVFYAIAAIS